MFKNIKSLFIVEEVPTDPAATPPSETPSGNKNMATPPPLPNQTMSTTPPPIPSGSGTVDQRIFDSLQKAIEDSNQEGFDFFEFKNSLKTLATIIPDEGTRFKSAFATAATMGLTVDKLLQSGAFYKSVLERERDNFNKAVSQQVDLSVTAKQKEVEKLQALIQKKAEEITRLTNEIASHQEEMAKAQGVITEATSKIETTKNNFHYTLDAVMGQIQSDIANIERYLKNQ